MKSLSKRSFRNLGISFLVAASVLSASPAWAMLIYADTPYDGTQVLDVESSDTIENVKAKLADKITVPAEEQCLTFDGVLLANDLTVGDYGIARDNTITMTELPVWATWSVTPDDPALGREVGNSIHTPLEATNYEVVDGALPVGVTLNESTGAISGRFDAAGPFAVTIGVTMICGIAELEWRGTVPGNLPATGLDTALTQATLALAATLGLSGAALVSFRRSRRVR